MEMKKILFAIVLIIFFSFSLISSEEFGYNLLEEPTFNNNTASVNSSKYWNTISLGPLDNANSTQFENNGGTLSIIASWLNGLIDTAALWESVSSISQLKTPEDIDMQNQNLINVTNISLVNSIKDSDTESRAYFDTDGAWVIEA